MAIKHKKIEECCENCYYSREPMEFQIIQRVSFTNEQMTKLNNMRARMVDCCINAPTIRNTDITNFGVFPCVSKTGWCGSWKLKEQEKEVS